MFKFIQICDIWWSGPEVLSSKYFFFLIFDFADKVTVLSQSVLKWILHFRGGYIPCYISPPDSWKALHFAFQIEEWIWKLVFCLPFYFTSSASPSCWSDREPKLWTIFFIGGTDSEVHLMNHFQGDTPGWEYPCCWCWALSQSLGARSVWDGRRKHKPSSKVAFWPEEST